MKLINWILDLIEEVDEIDYFGAIETNKDSQLEREKKAKAIIEKLGENYRLHRVNFVTRLT